MTGEQARFVLDGSFRRPRQGSVVIAGSPLRLFRLGAAGVRIIEAIEQARPLPAGHERLTARLVDAGAIHPAPVHAPVDPSELTIVVPAFSEAPRLRARACATIVVDDASPTPVAWPAPDADDPAGRHRTIRLTTNRGPGAARNAGLAAVTTPFVAFVDTDVAVDETTLLDLAGSLAAWDASLVAPRVVSDAPPGTGVLARFEQGRSPLDLGAEPARIAPTTRVSYVPAAVIVCRTDAIRAVGGFDEALRYGEDVDLVWRMHEHGARCRYEPSVTASHRTRAGLGAWLTQRFRYGTSAAPLARRHPGALAPVRMSGWSAATWGAIALGHPIIGASVGVGTTVALVRKLRDVPPVDSLRLAGLGHLYAGRLLAATVVRAWWPVAVAAALVSRRARWTLAAAVVTTAASEASNHRGTLGPLQAGVLRLADDASYGAGVWAGMWRERSLAAITPVLSSWPGRADR